MVNKCQGGTIEVTPLNDREKNGSRKMNRALGTDGTINLAIISLESEGKERVGLKRAF